jgi:hypothetical protein
LALTTVDVHVLIQAMCETRDEDIIEEVKQELWQFLDRTQWDIFQLILLDMRTSDVFYG